MGFSYEDYLYSETAERLDIDNTPGIGEEKNIRMILMPIVDAIFNLANEKWPGCMDTRVKGGSLHSGFRSHAVNAALPGSPTSAHCDGLGADLYPTNGKIRELMELIMDTPWIMKRIDQLILERGCVHVGMSVGTPRNEIRGEKYVVVDGKSKRTYPLVKIWKEEPK